MQKENHYIDIHSHILPGVDDGAINVSVSRQMLYKAYTEGIQTLIATPHYIPDHEINIEFIRKQFQCMEAEAKKIDQDFKLYLGNEIFYECGCVEAVKEGRAFTLAGSRYVLVEFSINESFSNIYKAMQEFIFNGYLPILAHMERYECLYKNTRQIEDLIELGCYMQVNVSRISGSIFDQKTLFVRKSIQEGLVHFLATDAHNMGQRMPRMESVLNKVSQKLDKSLLENLIYTNPLKILQNKCI